MTQSMPPAETIRLGSLAFLEAGEIPLHVPVLGTAAMVGLRPAEAVNLGQEFAVDVVRGGINTPTWTEGYIALRRADGQPFQMQTVTQRKRSQADFILADPVDKFTVASTDLRNWTVGEGIVVRDRTELADFLGRFSLYAHAKQLKLKARSA